MRAAVTVLVALLLGGIQLPAQTGKNQGKKKFPLRIHGFLLANYSARWNDAHPPGSEAGRFLWGDERLRLEISGQAPKKHLSLMFKGDVFHDAVANKPGGVVREAYVDYSRSSLDLRLGRQIVTWGVGDLVFINDVFPKDWNAFFVGRPIEYLKLGVDAAKLRLSTSEISAELVAVPFFQPDNLPNPRRFLFFDPFPAVSDRVLRQPASTTGDAEFALRLYRRLLGSDVSVYAYRGFWRQPSFHPDQFPQPTQLRGSYPRLAVYGASLQRNVGSNLISGEAGYYDSQEDRGGRDPAIPNSQFRLLVGYQRQVARELTLGAQYYAEITMDYSAYRANLPATFPMQDRVRHLVTLRLTKSLKYQTWRLSWFSFYSPSDQDALLIPEVWHAINDRFSVAVGANIFAGREQTSFLGQFNRNDNAYVSVRFDF
jgi:hypothetical protein